MARTRQRHRGEPAHHTAIRHRLPVSSLVSDLLGTRARRMLQALADGDTDPAALAALAVLNQTANGAVKAKGTIVAVVYPRIRPRAAGPIKRTGRSGRLACRWAAPFPARLRENHRDGLARPHVIGSSATLRIEF